MENMENYKSHKTALLTIALILLCVQKSDMRRSKIQNFHKIEIGMNDRGSHRKAIGLLWRLRNKKDRKTQLVHSKRIFLGTVGEPLFKKCKHRNYI